MIVFTGKEKLQEFYFKSSILESQTLSNQTDKFKITIDHINGVNFLNEQKYPLLFPKSMIKTIEDLPKTKTINYYFKGVITQKRKWVLNYNDDGIITNSDYGRDTSKKYNLDIDYYTSMSQSNFTLCPTGSCPWSYRLFESIMCFSIPIIEDNTDDIFHNQFNCLKLSENHVYNYEMVKTNYETLIKNFTLND